MNLLSVLSLHVLLAVTPAAAGASAVPEIDPSFAMDGRGAGLARIAARAFLEASKAVEIYPVERPGAGGRPAGPRDEPPPPEWPGASLGLVLCVEVDGAIRACEGDLHPPPVDLAAAATMVATRLAAAPGRSRRPALEAAEVPRAEIRAAFAVDIGSVDDAGMDGGKGGDVDPGTRGLRIEGKGGALILMPGEAGSMRKALRLARKAGVVPRFGDPTSVETFTPIAAGSGPLRIP